MQDPRGQKESGRFRMTKSAESKGGNNEVGVNTKRRTSSPAIIYSIKRPLRKQNRTIVRISNDTIGGAVDARKQLEITHRSSTPCRVPQDDGQLRG